MWQYSLLQWPPLQGNQPGTMEEEETQWKVSVPFRLCGYTQSIAGSIASIIVRISHDQLLL